MSKPINRVEIITGINQDHQRCDRCATGAHPIPDRRGAEVDALSREGLTQPVKWQVLAESRLLNGGEKMRPRPTSHDRVKGYGRLGDSLATAASVAQHSTQRT